MGKQIAKILAFGIPVVIIAAVIFSLIIVTAIPAIHGVQIPLQRWEVWKIRLRHRENSRRRMKK